MERECRRNLELIWLLEGLVPSYRTIAEFRRVNGSALRAVNRDFVLLCREPDLVGGETIGLDGSFFKASASDASITTKKRLEAELKQLERDLDAYTQSLDATDEQENHAHDLFDEDPALVSKLEELKEHQARKQVHLVFIGYFMSAKGRLRSCCSAALRCPSRALAPVSGLLGPRGEPCR